MKITERILQVLDFKKLTKYKFCKDLGVSSGFLDKARDISTDKYANILVYFPDINPEWLLTGKGEMLKNTINNEPNKKTPIYNSVEIDLLHKQIALLEENKEMLKKENERLIIENKELKKRFRKELQQSNEEYIHNSSMVAEPQEELKQKQKQELNPLIIEQSIINKNKEMRKR